MESIVITSPGELENIQKSLNELRQRLKVELSIYKEPNTLAIINRKIAELAQQIEVVQMLKNSIIQP